jgi:hypothetical protein
MRATVLAIGDVANRYVGNLEYAGFFLNRAAIGENAEGALLQAIKSSKPSGSTKCNPPAGRVAARDASSGITLTVIRHCTFADGGTVPRRRLREMSLGNVLWTESDPAVERQ